MFHLIITVFFRKYHSFIIVFKDMSSKFSEFIGCYLFYSAYNIQDIHDYIGKTKKAIKRDLVWIKKQHGKTQMISHLQQFCLTLSLIFESKNNIISIEMNQSYNCCLYLPNTRIQPVQNCYKPLIISISYATISYYTNTQKY